MKMTIRWNRLCSRTLFLSLAGAFCLEAIDIGWAQDETSEAAVAAPRAGNLLDLRGDLPNPRQIDVSALDKLPRVSVSTSDPRQAGKQIVYSGTPLLEALKAGGLVFDSGMAGLRDAVKMTVIVEAADGYQAAFSMAELDPELTDRVILLADIKDGQALPSSEGPFRVIVPGEKRPARWVRQVKSLTVRKN
jgi:hypothetical protein